MQGFLRINKTIAIIIIIKSKIPSTIAAIAPGLKLASVIIIDQYFFAFIFLNESKLTISI